MTLTAPRRQAVQMSRPRPTSRTNQSLDPVVVQNGRVTARGDYEAGPREPLTVLTALTVQPFGRAHAIARDAYGEAAQMTGCCRW